MSHVSSRDPVEKKESDRVKEEIEKKKIKGLWIKKFRIVYHLYSLIWEDHDLRLPPFCHPHDLPPDIQPRRER